MAPMPSGLADLARIARLGCHDNGLGKLVARLGARSRWGGLTLLGLPSVALGSLGGCACPSVPHVMQVFALLQAWVIGADLVLGVGRNACSN